MNFPMRPATRTARSLVGSTAAAYKWCPCREHEIAAERAGDAYYAQKQLDLILDGLAGPQTPLMLALAPMQLTAQHRRTLTALMNRAPINSGQVGAHASVPA